MTSSMTSPWSAAARRDLPPPCTRRPKGCRWRCWIRAPLAGRAFSQAQKFGAEIWIPVTAKSLDCTYGNGLFALQTECGQLLRARSVVVASGARYRRPEIENLAAFEGKGVWDWAS